MVTNGFLKVLFKYSIHSPSREIINSYSVNWKFKKKVMLISQFGKSNMISYFRFLKRCMGDFPSGCGWEEIVKKAECKKEADILNAKEELGICIPQPEKPFEIKDYDKDLTPINDIPCYSRLLNTAIIQKRSKHVMQQGTANTHVYVMHFVGGVNWENPLMGWNSGSNTLNCVELPFATLESAVSYAETNGWDFYIPHEPKERKMPKKDYGLNFSWNKRTRRSTK